MGFGGVLVVCFDFFGGFLGFFGGYFRLFGFCGGWVFFYLEGFLLVWGGGFVVLAFAGSSMAFVISCLPISLFCLLPLKLYTQL